MLTPAVARQSYGAAGRGDRQQIAFVAPQMAARLKRTQRGTMNMLTPGVARQSYGAAGRGDRQQTVFVAPQELKRFYVETCPLCLWRHKTFAEKGHLCRTIANGITCY